MHLFVRALLIFVVAVCAQLACTSFGSDGGSSATPEPDAGADATPDGAVPDPVTGTPFDASLAGLVLSAAPLTPQFNPATVNYSAGPVLLSEIFGATTTVTATARTASAQITVAGLPVPSGSASGPIPLKVGPNPIDIKVTSSDRSTTRNYTIVIGAAGLTKPSDYVKSSNTRDAALFGTAVAVSGNTLAVGSPGESSNATGVGGNQANSDALDSGAVYVFARTGGQWAQQAYLKASNTRANTFFGISVSLDGNTLAVGSKGEPSAAKGVNGNQSDASAASAGAVYVFKRVGSTWSQEAYLKASNSRSGAEFGGAVAVDGDTLAVGARGDSSNATGINGNQADSSANGAGAVYVFVRAGATWSQQAYVKASNARGFFLGPSFGYSVALSGDTMAVGSNAETSNATGVNGNQADTSVSSAGAAYVFRRAAGLWIQEAYVKPSNTQPNGDFGGSVSLGLDTLVVGSTGESSNATTSTGDQSNTSAPRAGAAYIYRRNGATWKQQAYVKAPNARAMALFGYSVRLAGDTLAVGSPGESSNAAGVNGDQSNTAAPQAGAVYVYRGSGGSWTSIAYAKGSTMEAQLLFGESVALTADTLAAGVSRDSSNARGVNGSRTNTAFNAGAVYTFR